jgi:hypothetical protein
MWVTAAMYRSWVERLERAESVRVDPVWRYSSPREEAERRNDGISLHDFPNDHFFPFHRDWALGFTEKSDYKMPTWRRRFTCDNDDHGVSDTERWLCIDCHVRFATYIIEYQEEKVLAAMGRIAHHLTWEYVRQQVNKIHTAKFDELTEDPAIAELREVAHFRMLEELAERADKRKEEEAADKERERAIAALVEPAAAVKKEKRPRPEWSVNR